MHISTTQLCPNSAVKTRSMMSANALKA
uniref:Uncharacterized protein n=1 Tax=Arundo donax TaxID=35708 RepID=A0A0A9E9P8_ARUDO